MELSRREFLDVSGKTLGALALAAGGVGFAGFSLYQTQLDFETARKNEFLRQLYLSKWEIYFENIYVNEQSQYGEYFSDLESRLKNPDFVASAAFHTDKKINYGELKEILARGSETLHSYIMVFPNMFTSDTINEDDDVISAIARENAIGRHILDYEENDVLRFYAQNSIEHGDTEIERYLDLVGAFTELNFITIAEDVSQSAQRQRKVVFDYMTMYLVFASNGETLTDEARRINNSVLVDYFHPLLHVSANYERPLIEEKEGVPYIFDWVQREYIPLPKQLIQTEQYQDKRFEMNITPYQNA